MNYTKALYWANLAPAFSDLTKLEWIAQTRDLDRFYSQSKRSLEQKPDYDSLRVFSGSTLFSKEDRSKGMKFYIHYLLVIVLIITIADTLIKDDLEFKTLPERKSFILNTPHFSLLKK